MERRTASNRAVVDDDGDRAPSRAPHSSSNGPTLPLALVSGSSIARAQGPHERWHGTNLIRREVCAFSPGLQHPAALIFARWRLGGFGVAFPDTYVRRRVISRLALPYFHVRLSSPTSIDRIPD